MKHNKENNMLQHEYNMLFSLLCFMQIACWKMRIGRHNKVNDNAL